MKLLFKRTRCNFGDALIALAHRYDANEQADAMIVFLVTTGGISSFIVLWRAIALILYISSKNVSEFASPIAETPGVEPFCTS